MIRIEILGGGTRVVFPRSTDFRRQTIFVALADQIATGCAVVPFCQGLEGSTVFLPFRANAIYFAHVDSEGGERYVRRWEVTQWGERMPANDAFTIEVGVDSVTLSIPEQGRIGASSLQLCAYAKDPVANHGWGSMIPDQTFGARAGHGDQYVSRFVTLTAQSGQPAAISRPRERLGAARIRIYQLLPRLFGNTNETRKPNGTIEENGCGKFKDINSRALSAIRSLGFTHIWLTGVLQQATGSDYSSLGIPSDDPDLLKGLAGSPYAIKDYFDVCPDYAEDPSRRLEEFQDLLARIHAHGMCALIDFVPNHVARSYRSDVVPELSFGRDDDRTTFFDPRNNFFYLRSEDAGHGPPLRLPTVADGRAASPTCEVLGTCDGMFDEENDYGRVTGNNVISWAPGLTDWYETVKLNHGYNFTDGIREYPHGTSHDKPLPDTWLKMDSILAYWQDMGVDGFRCDMAHMVPPEFWSWAIGRARVRNPEVFFVAEAYDNDPAKVPSGDPLFHALNDRRGNVMFDLLSAGFDAVYDDPSYKKLKTIYDGSGWANDLDDDRPHDFIFHNALRYAENHDEVRLAGKYNWGGIGMEVGRAVAPALFAMGRGPLTVYHGQEVGEPAEGAEGFSGDDARTTIFDYWCMPEYSKWVNAHRYDGARLTQEQVALRDFYGRLLRLLGEPAFVEGDHFPLNRFNLHNARFGRLPGEGVSGHWLHAFIRSNGQQSFIVATNFHPAETLRDILVQIPPETLTTCGIGVDDARIHLQDHLGIDRAAPYILRRDSILREGVPVPDIPPLTSLFLALKIMDAK